MSVMNNGILQIYSATGEGSQLQFVDENVLPKQGEEHITDFSGVYSVLPGDIIQFITRWGEPTNILVTVMVIQDLMTLVDKADHVLKIRYLPSSENKSWGERAKV